MKLETTPYSPEWYAARESINRHPASLSAIALGIAPGREELIKTFALGTEKEIGTYLQKLFDKGHEAEEGFRNAWFAELGQYFEPGCYTTEDGFLQATVDGYDEDTKEGMEHKLINQSLFESVSRGIVPKEYLPQIHQGMICTNSIGFLFAVSKGKTEGSATVWVDFDSSWEQRLRDGWAQFDRDVAEFQKNGKIELPDMTKKYELTLPQSTAIDYLEKDFSVLSDALDERIEEFDKAAQSLKEQLGQAGIDSVKKAIKWADELRGDDKKISKLFDQRSDLTGPQNVRDRFVKLIKKESDFVNEWQRYVDASREKDLLDLIQESNEKIAAFKRDADKFTTPISCDPVVIDWPRELKSKTIDAAKKHAATVIANAKIVIQNQRDRIVENLVWLDDKENPDVDWIGRLRHVLNLTLLAKQSHEVFKASVIGQVAQEKLREAQRVQRAEEAARKKILAEQEEQLRIKENEARLTAEMRLEAERIEQDEKKSEEWRKANIAAQEWVARKLNEAAPTVDITPELAEALAKAKEQATIDPEIDLYGLLVDAEFEPESERIQSEESEPSEDDYPEYVTAYPEFDNPPPLAWNPCLLKPTEMFQLAKEFVQRYERDLTKKELGDLTKDLFEFLGWMKETYIDGQV